MAWRRLTWGAAAVTLSVITATAVRPQGLLWLAERQLNDVYARHRLHPYRWAGAPHGPVTQTAAPSDELAPIRWNIRKAEELRGRNGQTLRLTARLELLAGRLDQAISAWQLAHLLDPADGELLSELGAAYARRAAGERRPADYAPALEAVLHGVELSPHSSVAAFNAAVLFQEFPLVRQAVSRWDDAIERERESSWLAEATERRRASHQALRDRSDESEDSLGHRLSLPHAAGALDPPGAVEFAMNAGLREWLRNGGRWSSALRQLADALQTQHRDRWLGDALAAGFSPQHQEAWAGLSDAVRHNSADQHERAAHAARGAMQRFRASGNTAGELRAVLELVMALHRQGKSASCLEALQGVRIRAANLSYQWIQGQAWLEEVVCLGQERRKDVVAAREAAYRWAKSSGFAGLELRALGFLIESHMANPLLVWDRGYPGLLTYRATRLAAERAHPLYYFLSEAARNWNHPRAAAALAEESVLTLESSPHRQLRAYMLTRLASLRAGLAQHVQASTLYRQASQAMAELGSGDGLALRAVSEVERAQGETVAGRPLDAIRRLRLLGDFSYGGFGPIFVRPSLGNALLAADHVEEAIREYDSAIQESERHRTELSDPFQREATNREIESAVRGLMSARLRQGDPQAALAAWRAYRGGPTAGPAAGTGRLVTVFLGDRISTWFEDAGGLVHSVSDALPIRQEAIRLAKLAGEPTSPFGMIQQSSARLSALLIHPFDARLNRVSLLEVDADDDAATIPWPLLANRQGRPLLERVAVIQTGRGGHRRAAPAQWDDALILANPELGREWATAYPPLEDATREARFLSARLPHSRSFHGKEVNWEKVAPLLPLHRIVHFAGHGMTYGGFGAVLMAGADGSARPVSASDIRPLDLHRVELVVLAACATGGTGPFGPATLDSLVNAFLTAGASLVVAPRWNAASRPARVVVEGFYERLLSGATAPEAMRLAMLDASRAPDQSHPYYWAGFQVFSAQ